MNINYNEIYTYAAIFTALKSKEKFEILLYKKNVAIMNLIQYD